MNKSSFGSTMFSFLMAFALLWEASGHMHDVITGLASTPDGEWLFVRSRFWLLRSQDQGKFWTPLRNPDDINWEDETTAGPPDFILSPDFKNDTTLLYKMYLSIDAGETWSRNLDEKLTSRKFKGVQYEICASDPNPFVFSSNFANDGTIFAVACNQEEPTLATLLYSEDFGETFIPVQNLKGFEFGSWRPILTATTDEIYFQRIVGLDSQIFTPISGNPTKWRKIKTLKNFEIQSIKEDHSSGGLLIIDRNSQTLYRLNQDNKLTPITLPSAATATTGDQLLVSAYSHKGVGTNSSLVVLRSTCQNRQLRMGQLGVECPSPTLEDEDQNDYVLLSTDEGTTWKNLTIDDWFFLQGGGTSTEFKVPEFTHVLGIPGTPTVFLGTFTGLYRSEDHGESWLELDTIAHDVIGMNAGKISSDSVQLSVCTEDASCWSGAIDIGSLRDKSILKLPEGSLEQVVRPPEDISENENFHVFQYNTIAFSDGIGFLADKNGVLRYADGFNGTTSRVNSVGFLEKSNVQGIRFSPDFENDDTVFIAGWRLGVFRSYDRGLNFENVFNATANPEVPDGLEPVQLILSPDFASDGVLFTYLTDGNPREQDSLLFISEDSGSTWAAVDQGENPPRMVSLALAIDNSNEGVVEYSLLGVQKDGDVWVNKRKGQAKEFGQWEPLLYLVKGKFTSVLPKESVAGKGFCRDSVLGTPNGELYMSMLTGGIAYGKLKGTKFTKPKASGLLQRFRFGGTGQTLVKDFRKSYFEGLVEIEGVFFGAFFNEIWMSLDDGKTWTSIYKLASREPRFAGCTESCCFRGCVPSGIPSSNPSEFPSRGPSSVPSRSSAEPIFIDVSHKLAEYASDELANQFAYIPYSNFLAPLTFDVNGDGFADFLYHHHSDTYDLFFPGSDLGSYWDLGTSAVKSNNEIMYKAGKVDVIYKASVPEVIDDSDLQDVTSSCRNNGTVNGDILDDFACLEYPDFHGEIVLDFDRDGQVDALNTIGGGVGIGEGGTGLESMLFWGDDTTTSNKTESKSYLHLTGGRSALMTAGLFSGEPQRSYGIHAADFNNDGYLDLFYVNRFRKFDLIAPGHIYINRGASEPRQFDLHPEVSEHSVAAVLTDFDQDGFANEFLILQDFCRFEDCSEQEPRCVVYKWDALNDSFMQLWASPLFFRGTELISAASGDFNGDGLTDVVILVSSKGRGELRFWYSSKENELLGSSTDIVEIPSNCKPQHSMRAADFNLNGRLDLLVLCLDGTSQIFTQSSLNDNWEPIDSDSLGSLGNPDQIKAPVQAFFDRCFGDNLDQCEVDDLEFLASLKQAFELENGEINEPQPQGQGVTVFDYNNDGFMDIFLAIKLGLNFLFENKGVSGHNFLSLKLKGTTSNLDGIGAIVKLVWNNGVGTGEKIQLWEHNCQTFESDVFGSRDSRIIFGLGSQGVPLKLEIRWPSGKISYLEKEELKEWPMTMNYNEITIVTEPE